jgi:hypothetical protein
MLLAAIFFVSLSTLAFEILLARVFSIGQWNHLSFMVIGIALFGFAAAGSFLCILDARKKNWETLLASKVSIAVLIAMYSSGTLSAFVGLNKLPLDYFRLPLEPAQSLYLLTAFILLAFPFFLAGLVITLGYVLLPEKIGLVYFASMAGSACGAVIPAIGLPYLGEERLIVISALLPLVTMPFCVLLPRGIRTSGKKGPLAVRTVVGLYGLAVLSFAVFLMTAKGFSIIGVKPSPYKALSQILQFPNTRVAETADGIRGRTERVETPYVRFAPGLSLKYTQALPSQEITFRDGDHPFVLYHLPSANDAYFAKYTLPYSGYYLTSNPQRVLLILNGGGSAIADAVASGAVQITLVLGNPQLARMVQTHYNLPVIRQNSRAFLARSEDRFDIIQVEDWGASIPGADALNQSHLLTGNAFRAYLQHLTPQGVVIVSRKLLLPPADIIRLWAEAYEALKDFGFKKPQNHLAVLRNWDTYTLLVSAKSLEHSATLRKFAIDLNFDLVWLPHITKDMVNRFNMFDEAYHFLEINRLAGFYKEGKEKDYFRAYLLDVAPQSDNRPFPGRFLKWAKVKALYKSMGSRLYALLMSGEVVVSVVFFEALVVAVILLFLPLFFITKGVRKPSSSQVIFFLGVGAGFMFSELFFIKRFILIFGDPVISFTIVLAAILVFAGLGGLWVQRKKAAGLRNSLIALVAVLVLTLIVMNFGIHYLLRLSGIRRYIAAILLMFPAGFLMGLPFPLGMRYILKNPGQRAYAWSSNGCASVLTSIASAQIALSYGIPYILGCAVSAYLLVLACVGMSGRLESSN